MIDRDDLEYILQQTADLWSELRNQRIFLTGGTGFVGKWLLESFNHINSRLGLNAGMLVLSRNPDSFFKNHPDIKAYQSIQFMQGDIKEFKFPAGEYAYLVHAAAEVNNNTDADSKLQVLSSILAGTQRVLDFAATHGTRKFLLISSGAVYGEQPGDISNLTEGDFGKLDPLAVRSAYGEGKRVAEMLACLYAAKYAFEAKIARCFTFVGPYLPLDGRYAVGNFISDFCHGGPIIVEGDGSACRSYLYAADLAVWLWTILLKGQSVRPYNVGSDQVISIKELAELVSRLTHPALEVRIKSRLGEGNTSRYAPSIERAKSELGLVVRVPLPEALSRTIVWYKKNGVVQNN